MSNTINVVVESKVRLIEELCVNAWPALQTCSYDGWLLRFASGYSRRSNSVSPLYESSIDLDQKIRHCEMVYERWGQNTVFKMTSAAAHHDLDRALDEKGYLGDAHSKVLFLDDISLPPAPEYADAQLLSAAAPSWIDDYVALSGTDRTNIPPMKEILNNVVFPKAFATLRDGDTPVAVGMAVVEREHVCFNAITVNKAWRGRGMGTRLMRHLITWARDNGARHGYLQVMRDNEVALRLYHGLGFQYAYDYWYRVKQTKVNVQSAV